MKSKVLITCFSYGGNRKYMFNPDHLRADLKRILTLVLNKNISPLEEVTILTDIVPFGYLVNEIRTDFQQEVERFLREKGYHGDIVRTGKGGKALLPWLRQICEEASVYFHTCAKELYKEVLEALPFILRSSTVVEFASLFTNFVQIKSKDRYELELEKVFKSMKPQDNLFFYYSGHGVRFINSDKVVEKVCLIIPSSRGSEEYYNRNSFSKLISRCAVGNIFMVFDCCHSSEMIDLPFQINFEKSHSYLGRIKPTTKTRANIIYLGSTKEGQTCGFYDKGEYGSIFTYHLLSCLNSLRKEISFDKLYRCVEVKVQAYRNKSGKPPQNMFISVTSISIQGIPKWLLDN